MKQNKLLIVGMLVLPILLSACGGEWVKDTNVTQTVSTSKTNESPTTWPVSVVKKVLDEAYDERKKDISDRATLKQIKTSLEAYIVDVNGTWSVFEKQSGCIEDLIKNVCDKWQYYCAWINDMKMMPTWICKDGWEYRIISKNGTPIFVLAAKMRNEELSNFDGANFFTATVDEFQDNLNGKLNNVQNQNWFYVVAWI